MMRLQLNLRASVVRQHKTSFDVCCVDWRRSRFFGFNHRLMQGLLRPLGRITSMENALSACGADRSSKALLRTSWVSSGSIIVKFAQSEAIMPLFEIKPKSTHITPNLR